MSKFERVKEFYRRIIMPFDNAGEIPNTVAVNLETAVSYLVPLREGAHIKVSFASQEQKNQFFENPEAFLAEHQENLSYDTRRVVLESPVRLKRTLKP